MGGLQRIGVCFIPQLGDSIKPALIIKPSHDMFCGLRPTIRLVRTLRFGCFSRDQADRVVVARGKSRGPRRYSAGGTVAGMGTSSAAAWLEFLVDRMFRRQATESRMSGCDVQGVPYCEKRTLRSVSLLDRCRTSRRDNHGFARQHIGSNPNAQPAGDAVPSRSPPLSVAASRCSKHW